MFCSFLGKIKILKFTKLKVYLGFFVLQREGLKRSLPFNVGKGNFSFASSFKSEKFIAKSCQLFLILLWLLMMI